MKKNIKINRYGIAGFLFIIGLIISTFVLFNTVDVVSRIVREDKANKSYKYEERYFISYNYNNNILTEEDYVSKTKELLESLKKLDCNVSICDVGINVNNQIDDMFIELIINSKEDFCLYSQNECYIKPNMYKNKIFVGENILDLTLNKDRNTLIISDFIIEIADVLKNDNASGIDYRILGYLDDFDELKKNYFYKCMAERLSFGILLIDLYGNEPIDDSVDTLYSTLNNSSLVYTKYIPTYEGNDYQNYWYRFYNKIFISACVIFSVFTLFLLSYLWLANRKKEISIRKTYGYSGFEIFMLLVGDITKLCLISYLFAFILEIIYCLFFSDFSFFDSLFPLKLFAIFLGILFISILCALNLIRLVSTISPIDAIKEDV